MNFINIKFLYSLRVLSTRCKVVMQMRKVPIDFCSLLMLTYTKTIQAYILAQTLRVVLCLCAYLPYRHILMLVFFRNSFKRFVQDGIISFCCIFIYNNFRIVKYSLASFEMHWK